MAIRDSFLASIMLLICISQSSSALWAQDFYRDKTITLLVSSSAGSSGDLYSRLLITHMTRHIPGNPSIVVQNMPGLGGVIAANYIFNNSKPDGLVMGQLPWGIWTGHSASKFDFNKMTAIGAAGLDSSVVYCRKDKYRNLDDLITKSNKQVKFGVAGDVRPRIVAEAVEQLLDKKNLFTFVLGYTSFGDLSVAIDRGEIECMGSTISQFVNQIDQQRKNGVVALVQAGYGERLQNVPTIEDIAQTSAGKQHAKVAGLRSTNGNTYWLPPGVPTERSRILQGAFSKAISDSDFISTIRKRNLPVVVLNTESFIVAWAPSASCAQGQCLCSDGNRCSDSCCKN